MIETDNIELLGRRTICKRDENGSTGYTIFTATSVYDGCCVSVKQNTGGTIGFDCNYSGNIIEILCDSNIQNFSQISGYILDNASIVRCSDDENGMTYAVRVMFPYLSMVSQQNPPIEFNVFFNVFTSGNESGISGMQTYFIQPK